MIEIGLWNYAYQLNLCCVIVDRRLGVWGHCQSLRQFMEVWRKWYGEPELPIKVLGAESAEHCGIELPMPPCSKSTITSVEFR